MIEIDGHEFLFYTAFPIQVGIIRATTAGATTTTTTAGLVIAQV